jgi:hypothetical protein
LLRSGDYGVLAAEDGYLLLRRGVPPSLDGTVPEGFYRFLLADTPPAFPLRASFGDAVELVGYDLTVLNVVQAQRLSARISTYWRALRPLALDYEFPIFFTADDGAIVWAYDSGYPSTDWYPAYEWQPDEVIRIESPILTLARDFGVLIGVTPPRQDPWDPETRLRPTPGADLAGRLADHDTLIRLFSFER